MDSTSRQVGNRLHFFKIYIIHPTLTLRFCMTEVVKVDTPGYRLIREVP